MPENIASLVHLAELDQLPKHQFMDETTLQWIKENRPEFGSVRGFDPNIADKIHSKLARFTPKKEWFLNSNLIDSIHGIRHIMRVTTHAALLSAQHNLTVTKKKNCLTASSIHDLRRCNDKGDVNHGLRAAEWFIANQGKISESFRVKFSKEDIQEIQFLITAHETSYGKINNRQYQKYKITLDILKTADALDRYRQPKMKWWLNEAYLKIIPTNNHKALAFAYVVESEERYLSGKDSYCSVIEAFKEALTP